MTGKMVALDVNMLGSTLYCLWDEMSGMELAKRRGLSEYSFALADARFMLLSNKLPPAYEKYLH